MVMEPYHVPAKSAAIRLRLAITVIARINAILIAVSYCADRGDWNTLADDHLLQMGWIPFALYRGFRKRRVDIGNVV